MADQPLTTDVECPACGEPMTAAREGKEVAHLFAHRLTCPGCNFNTVGFAIDVASTPARFSLSRVEAMRELLEKAQTKGKPTEGGNVT